MGPLQKLETWLDEVLHKKAPFQLPPNGKRGLAYALWWIALIAGLLQLWAAWMFWHAAHTINRLVDFANSLSSVYGTTPYSAPAVHLGFFFYLSLLVLVLDGVILLVAVSPLKAHRKSGWNWLFYSALINMVYGIFRIFSDYGGGIGSLIWALIGTVVGLYFLFQTREYFLPGAHDTVADHKVGVEKTTPKVTEKTTTKSTK